MEGIIIPGVAGWFVEVSPQNSEEWRQLLQSNAMDAEMESWQVDIYSDAHLGRGSKSTEIGVRKVPQVFGGSKLDANIWSSGRNSLLKVHGLGWSYFSERETEPGGRTSQSCKGVFGHFFGRDFFDQQDAFGQVVSDL